MARAVDHGQTGVHQHLPEQLDVALVFPPQCATFFTFKDLDGLPGSCQQHWWQRGGEDKTRSVGAHCVNHGRSTCDVAAHTAEGLPWNRT